MNLVKIYLFLFLFSNVIYAQNDCSDAIVVCGNSGFQGLKALGQGKIIEYSSLNSCVLVESNSIWLRLSIKTAGTLGFILKPESPDLNEDFDFIIFGPNATCNSLGQALRCSSTNPKEANLNHNYTGMTNAESDTTEGPGSDGNSYVKWINVTPGESYFLVVDRPIGSSNFSLQWLGSATFNSPPTLNIPNITALNMEKADKIGTANQSLPFDLTKNNQTIIDGQTDVAVTYHTSSTDAIINSNPITDPSQYKNIENPQTIYARITNTLTQCYNWSSFTIKVSDKIIFTETQYETCDDNDTNTTDGKTKINLSDITASILANQDTSNLTINYYLSENDAKTNSNPILNSFTNSISFKQSIFAKASTEKSSTTIQEIKIIVNSLPKSLNSTLVQCEIGINPDGLCDFNLNEATPIFNNNNSDITTTYHITKEDALENINPVNTTYTNTSNPQTLFVRNSNNKTRCSTINSLTLKVNAISETLYALDPVCDDDGDEDGFYVFDLNNASIPFSNTQNIKYYANENHALLEQNPIQNFTSYKNETPYNQFVYARIEEGNDCYGISKIKLEVNKLPHLKTNTISNVCENNKAYFTTLDAGILDYAAIDNFTFTWTKDNFEIPNEKSSKLNINETGIYKVSVKNNSNCIKTRTIEVTASDIATITSIDIIDLLVDNSNKITVNVTGKGDYEFSLNMPNGPFQKSNVFENVISGIHEIYINDKKNCGLINKTVAVIGAPNYFTPNNDGYHDYWNITGLNTSANKKSLIYIYDRYGKLLKQIYPSDLGWDGTFTGNPMPADDYWYSLKLEDGRETKGHFSLKR
ncbi:T9SS type B sorting domain-containing protein [Flavobacterium sp. LC2016-12]|uniref:T9SS type B sorting domain-containing protein n=1 Tax=Flavobacterium sp. LC2016-12 TaxID=2783794 RepID=UPI001889D6D8|nr:T9SS type B sorting domain-containing protein [Flavobacterium sp. LC2016-12]MBF4465504.1 T9SS type B sorting domain-containing protein [Flavobacterium sp. LC2016-12]